MKKLIIEARINEYAMRDVNPNVPWTADEIARDAAECREAGASVVHFHVRNPQDGSPGHGVELYSEAVAKIREKCDILIHPTLGYVTLGPKEARVSHILKMCQDLKTRPDFAPVDMGTTNVDKYDVKAKTYITRDLVYMNSTETLQFLIENIRSTGLKLYLVSWNIGFTRTIATFVEMGLVPEPVYLAFCLTDGQILAGHPGTIKGLEAHLDFLPPIMRVEWTVCNFGGNLFAVAAAAIERGGHVSIGLGDYPYPELGTPTNAELAARVVQMARDAGREVATPEETRGLLGMN